MSVGWQVLGWDIYVGSGVSSVLIPTGVIVRKTFPVLQEQEHIKLIVRKSLLVLQEQEQIIRERQ